MIWRARMRVGVERRQFGGRPRSARPDELHAHCKADPARVKQAVEAENPGTYLRACNGCERDIAKSVGADRVMIGWIFKMSSLVLSLHVVVEDVATGKILYAKTFDFRGDNERAWKRAADYMVESLGKRTKESPNPTN